jgi:hypothetical protein
VVVVELTGLAARLVSAEVRTTDDPSIPRVKIRMKICIVTVSRMNGGDIYREKMGSCRRCDE